MVLYANHLRKTGLIDQIDELEGCTLVCDCPVGEASPADVLIAELTARALDQADRPQEAAVARWGSQPKRKWPDAVGKLLLMTNLVSCVQGIPLEVTVRWKQESVVMAFASPPIHESNFNKRAAPSADPSSSSSLSSSKSAVLGHLGHIRGVFDLSKSILKSRAPDSSKK